MGKISSLSLNSLMSSGSLPPVSTRSQNRSMKCSEPLNDSAGSHLDRLNCQRIEIQDPYEIHGYEPLKDAS